MTKYVSGIVQRASPNVGEGRIRPAGRSLGTPALKRSNTSICRGLLQIFFVQFVAATFQFLIKWVKHPNIICMHNTNISKNCILLLYYYKY